MRRWSLRFRVTVTIVLLADHPDAIASVADLRWREWGHAPEPQDP